MTTDLAIEKKLREVTAAFRLKGTFQSWKQLKVGNVNQTYRVKFLRSDGAVKSYMVQNLNIFVFNRPQQVMRNISLVTEHIRSEYPKSLSLHFFTVATGENYYVDEAGFWRVFNYVDSTTYDVCENLTVLRNAGAAFGEFQAALANFDASQLFETIVDFHHTPKRLATLFADAEKNVAGRAATVQEELDWVRSVADRACQMQTMLDAGDLPLRVAHNDTKINNVLFDKESGEALLVIDLDTVMPGLVGHDFGDAARCACNFVAEDSPETEKAGVDMAKFQAFTSGFMSRVKLTSNEIDTMALGCFTLATELGSRFLADYLNGDVYFRTEYPEHNLVRARCQFALAKDMLKRFDEMNDVVQDCAKR